MLRSARDEGNRVDRLGGSPDDQRDADREFQREALQVGRFHIEDGALQTRPPHGLRPWTGGPEGRRARSPRGCYLAVLGHPLSNAAFAFSILLRLATPT